MQVVKLPPAHAEFRTLSKPELHQLADGLADPEPISVGYCIEFVVAETKGVWHGRARAMMCRRLKHLDLSRDSREKLLRCILGRLLEGQFSEQFKDQLRLALRMDSKQTLKACEAAIFSAKPHVRRYATWVLALPRGENAA